MEEELLLVEPGTGRPLAVAETALRTLDDSTQEEAGESLEFELQRQQLETSTKPCLGLSELDEELRRGRSLAAEAAGRAGARVTALATSPVYVEPQLVRKRRYLQMAHAFGLTAYEQLTCGCHVHVGVSSPDEGVAVLDRIRPWLPVLLALSANSPFWQGQDSAYASFRYQAWNRWPSAGPTDTFGSVEVYRQTVQQMIRTGTLLDTGMVYFDARLSEHYPTVEIRVADVCLYADDAVLIAALARALVETEARRWREDSAIPAHRIEMLRLATWRASRSGLDDVLLNPRTGEPEPAPAIANALFEHVKDALNEAGDSAAATELLGAVLARGNGAAYQRNACRDGSLASVIESTAAITARLLGRVVSQARITVDPAFRVGPVDPRMYGSFVEHLGRCVYTGIYEPDHPTADEHGFRKDVADLTRELGVPVIRYPGGNFVSGYRWEDGIGPAQERPTRLDLAWHSIEPNAVGTDEFCAWARRVGSEPMLAVNLGTRGPDAAARLVEYCNHPGGTYWSDLRVKNGAAEPHDVRVWCLGNEMDGDWQIGHKTAEEYGRLAAETAKAMRLVDPGIELVVCGSSGPQMPSFGDWEATVLGHCYQHVDYMALHSYYHERDRDRSSFLASATEMDQFIEAVISTVDHVRAKGRHSKRINLSFDEWNVWHTQGQQAEGEWEHAPRLIEDQYSLIDAVVVGNLLISLLRHADRVHMACLAQLVNAIGAIRSEPGGPSWRQTIFHPFALTSRHGRGTVLRTPVTAPEYDTPAFGMVPKADAVAVLSDSGNELTVFAVNRDQHEPLPVTIDVRSLPALRVAHHTYIGDDEPTAANVQDAPDRVIPRTGADIPVDGGALRTVLPPLSWNMLRVGGKL